MKKIFVIIAIIALIATVSYYGFRLTPERTLRTVSMHNFGVDARLFDPVIDSFKEQWNIDGDGEPMITVPALDRRKVGDMHIFTTKERLDIVVSSEVLREMRKKRML